MKTNRKIAQKLVLEFDKKWDSMYVVPKKHLIVKITEQLDRKQAVITVLREAVILAQSVVPDIQGSKPNALEMMGHALARADELGKE